MPKSVALLFKHAVSRSEAQNPRESVCISADRFRQLSSRLGRIAEDICHVQLSKHMKRSRETITTRHISYRVERVHFAHKTRWVVTVDLTRQSCLHTAI